MKRHGTISASGKVEAIQVRADGITWATNYHAHPLESHDAFWHTAINRRMSPEEMKELARVHPSMDAAMRTFR